MLLIEKKTQFQLKFPNQSPSRLPIQLSLTISLKTTSLDIDCFSLNFHVTHVICLLFSLNKRHIFSTQKKGKTLRPEKAVEYSEFCYYCCHHRKATKKMRRKKKESIEGRRGKLQIYKIYHNMFAFFIRAMPYTYNMSMKYMSLLQNLSHFLKKHTVSFLRDRFLSKLILTS